MRCPGCRKGTPSGAKFCPQCGAQLALICRDCGMANSRARKLCTKCRRPLKKSAAPRSPQQRAIAPEIARLSKELQARNRDLTAALEQQTATAEILRVISSSLTDLQPVLEVVAENAAGLCEAADAVIYRLEDDVLRSVAIYGSMGASETQPVTRDTVIGRAVVDRQTVHIHDLAAVPEAELPASPARRRGVRTMLATPLLREGRPIGGIIIR